MNIGIRPRALACALALTVAACTDVPPTAPEIGAEVPEPEAPLFSFGTPAADHALGIASAGNTLTVVGHTGGSLDGPNAGSGDVFVRRYHEEGELLWANQFGSSSNDSGRGVATDAANNTYVVGSTDGSIAGSRGGRDAFIRKYDNAGKVLWTRQFGSASNDNAYGVAVDAQGNAYVAGHTTGALGTTQFGGVDAFLRKYSPSGNVLWTQQIGTPLEERGLGVAIDPAGAVYLVGTTRGALVGGAVPAQWDAFVARFAFDGTPGWVRQFGTTGATDANAVAVDGTGAVLVAGTVIGSLQGQSFGGEDGFVRKYSGAGAVLGTWQFGGPSDDQVTGIGVDPANAFYVAGSTTNKLGAQKWGGWDSFVRKYNSNGAIVWTHQFGTTHSDLAHAVSVRSASKIYVAGQTGGVMVGGMPGGVDAFLRRLNGNGNAEWTDQ